MLPVFLVLEECVSGGGVELAKTEDGMVSFSEDCLNSISPIEDARTKLSKFQCSLDIFHGVFCMIILLLYCQEVCSNSSSWNVIIFSLTVWLRSSYGFQSRRYTCGPTKKLLVKTLLPLSRNELPIIVPCKKSLVNIMICEQASTNIPLSHNIS